MGLSDAGAHVGQLCDAPQATDLLGNWVRDREVMSLERAVQKLAGEPAAIFGLEGRGTFPGKIQRRLDDLAFRSIRCCGVLD